MKQMNNTAFEDEKMTEKLLRIAIDGPAGAGKTTISKRLASELGIDRIDTGAMYRAIALKLARTGVDYNNAEALASMLDTTDIDFKGGHVLLDGEDVEGLIRTPEISELASASSTVLAIREKLVAMQRAIGQKKSVVMDGRDITTNVLPFAEFKFYLTASAEERARRRALEYTEKMEGSDAQKQAWLSENLPKIEEEIRTRDYRDMHREHNPLTIAPDAIVVDSSDLTIEEVLSYMLEIIRN
jgi:cytidylate kinase